MQRYASVSRSMMVKPPPPLGSTSVFLSSRLQACVRQEHGVCRAQHVPLQNRLQRIRLSHRCTEVISAVYGFLHPLPHVPYIVSHVLSHL